MKAWWRIALSMVFCAWTGYADIWGVKSGSPVSEPPSTLFRLADDGTFIENVGVITSDATPITVDGLAESPEHVLYGFQIGGAAVGSRLVVISKTSAVATVAGPYLSERNIRGATFTLDGRLLVFDNTRSELLWIDPSAGTVLGSPVPLQDLPPGGTSYSTDLCQRPDGALLFGYGDGVEKVGPVTGVRTLLHENPIPFADGYAPWCVGLAVSPFSSPEGFMVAMDVNGKDSMNWLAIATTVTNVPSPGGSIAAPMEWRDLPPASSPGFYRLVSTLEMP